METRLTREAIASPLMAQLPIGAFLSVGGETPNTMTIGWGGLTFYWGKDVFVAPVRPQRFTHDILKKEMTFTVSVPAPGAMKDALRLAGTLSGRDRDKFKAAGIEALPGREVAAPIVAGCAFYLECRVLAVTAFDAPDTDDEIKRKMYPSGDFHTLFHGEIIACYPGV